MDTFTLPPSPSWQLSSALACNDNGLLAYSSRSEVAIINLKSDGKFDISVVSKAHKEKLNAVVFSPTNGCFKNCMGTCGDDGMVRVWNFQECRLLYCHSGHKDGVRVVGLDWSRADTNRLVSINDLGSIVCWDLASNTIRKLHCGIKVLPLCLACCPHDKDIIAIGCKGGATHVIDVKGSGKLIYRLRGNDQDIISISWCPVPYNVIKVKRNIDIKDGGDKNESETSEENKDLLLATGGVDKSIFIWRTGSDGRYEIVLNLPNSSISTASNFPRKKGTGNNMMLWTCVHWVDAYTLLSTSQFGELLSWDLSKVPSNRSNKKLQPRLLHSRHYKGCFSIACPVVYDEISDLKTEKRVVWTTAMDKHVVACSLASGNIVLEIPTLGGGVICMETSPLDPNRLAIGSSDNKVFVWNLSNLGSLNITPYWRKIAGKVMAICWHPTEENWLAYGTGDGHVGLIDVGSNKLPTVFRLHHRKAVYRLCWAPPVLKSEDTTSDNKLVLYSVGDGDVFQYTANPLEPDEEPKSLNAPILNSIDSSLGFKKPLIRSEVVFKSDLTSFCVGNENGSVYIINFKTLTLQHVLYPHKKLMNNLEWHPETVASDNSISPYKDWLATSCDNIKVYNIPQEGQPELVATLSGHSEKIVGLAWSPHFNGRLVSGSYDHSVQVWDVPSQSCVGIYLGHSMAVMCVLFSPKDPDFVISGSNDSTVRLWKVSDLTVTTTKPEKKKDRLENKMKERAGAEEATELTVEMSILSQDQNGYHKNYEHNSSANTSVSSNQSFPVTTKGTEDFKKRQKTRAVFRVTAPKLVQAKHFDVLYQRWLASSSTDKGTPPTPSPSPQPEMETPSVMDLGYLDFFGDDKAMCRLLMVEETQLVNIKHNILAQESALWRGDVSQMIKDAIAKKKLSEWLVSIAPLAGFELWEEACAAFADQLVECGEVCKASTYLLAIHKVQEAVQLLADHKFHREAIAIAKCRLPADDPLIAQLYSDWGDTVKMSGLLSLAAHCYLTAKNTQALIETLGRIKELKSLKMAAAIASQAGQSELADSLAVECLTMCVVAGNLTVGYHLITEMPQYQYWRVWLRASELLFKMKNRNEVEVFDWLEGHRQGQLALFDELEKVCSPLGQVYEKILPHLSTNKTPEFERDMWFYVSGQLAAACAAKLEAKPAHFLRHTILAFSAAFHFQTNNHQSLAVLLTLSTMAPTGLFDKRSILTAEYKTAEEKQLIRSLKAFVCASIVHWMRNNWKKVENLQCSNEKTPVENGDGDKVKEIKEYKMSWFSELLKNCSADVLDSENVLFFVKKAQKQELQDVVTKENIMRNSVANGNSKGKLKKSKNKSETVIEKTDDKKVVEKSRVDEKVTSNKSLTEGSSNVDEKLNGTAQKKETFKTVNMIQDITDNNGSFRPSQKVQGKIDSTSFTEKTENKSDKVDSSSVTEMSENKPDKVDSSSVMEMSENKSHKIDSSSVTEMSENKPDKVDLSSVTEMSENKLDKIDYGQPISAGINIEISKSDKPPNKIINGASVETFELSEKKEEKSDSIICNVATTNKDSGKSTCEFGQVCLNGSVDPSGGLKEKNDKSNQVNSLKSIVANISKENVEKHDPSSTEDVTITNGSENHQEIDNNTISRVNEIKEIDEILQKFEAERVSVPSPFTAYVSIKYLIDNLVKKQDTKLAQSLQENCDQFWNKSK